MKFLSKKFVSYFFTIMLFCLHSNGLMSYPLFFSDGSLTYGAKQLCKILQISDKVHDAKEFNDFFQENFLRPKGLERWEDYSPKIAISTDIYNDLIEVCDLLDMIENVYPIRNDYDYIVLFGSSTQIMEQLCRYVKNELQQFLISNKKPKFYFLSGERILNEAIDSPEIITELNELGKQLTETNAAKLIWEKEFLGEIIPCKFIDVKLSELNSGDNNVRRPTTGDTMKKLLNDHELMPGNMLAVSNNPFIGYQDNVCRNILSDNGWFDSGGTLETVGYSMGLRYSRKNFGMTQKQTINILLDNIARCAYEELKQIK